MIDLSLKIGDPEHLQLSINNIFPEEPCSNTQHLKVTCQMTIRRCYEKISWVKKILKRNENDPIWVRTRNV